MLDDLRNPAPEVVVARGEIAVRGGEARPAFPALEWDRFVAYRGIWDVRRGKTIVPPRISAK